MGCIRSGVMAPCPATEQGSAACTAQGHPGEGHAGASRHTKHAISSQAVSNACLVYKRQRTLTYTLCSSLEMYAAGGAAARRVRSAARPSANGCTTPSALSAASSRNSHSSSNLCGRGDS